MISKLVSSMTGDRTPKPAFTLTDEGLSKLDYLLTKFFRDKKKVPHTDILSVVSLDRNTISKIRNKTAGVNKVTLETLFEQLLSRCQENYPEDNFDEYSLEDSDYQEFHRHKNSQKISKISIEDTLVEKLKTALKKLNYQQQEKDFSDYLNQIVEIKYAATFLIHGQPGYGQRWLVNRLCDQVDDGLTNALCHPIHLTIRHRDIQKIWDDLAARVDSTSNNPEKIVEMIYQHWQTQPILLCFHNVDVVGCQELKKFIEPFWQYLNNKINQEVTVNYRALLLFLIDNYGEKKFSNNFRDITQISNNDNNRFCEINELKLFERGVINNWVVSQTTLFSKYVQNANINDIVKDIVSYNNTPTQAMKQICRYFDLDWELDIEKPLKL